MANNGEAVNRGSGSIGSGNIGPASNLVLPAFPRGGIQLAPESRELLARLPYAILLSKRGELSELHHFQDEILQSRAKLQEQIAQAFEEAEIKKLTQIDMLLSQAELWLRLDGTESSPFTVKE
jgi:hypothetical protein